MEEAKLHVFKVINISNSGAISVSELHNFLKVLEPDITLGNVYDMIKRYDTTNTTTLNYNDFSMAMGDSFSRDEINIAYDSIFEYNNVVSNLYDYFKILKLLPFYNLSIYIYLDMIATMIGDNINDFIKLLEFLKIPLT